MGDIVDPTQRVTDIAAFIAAGDVRKSYFPEPCPVTSTVQVAALYDPGLVVEITAVAGILEGRATPL